MNGMRRCALVLLLVCASCGSVWRGKALAMYQQHLDDNPGLSLERKWLLKHNKMRSRVTTEADYHLLYHLQYGRKRHRVRDEVRFAFDLDREVVVRTYTESTIPHHFLNGVYRTDLNILHALIGSTWVTEPEPGWPE